MLRRLSNRALTDQAFTPKPLKLKLWDDRAGKAVIIQLHSALQDGSPPITSRRRPHSTWRHRACNLFGWSVRRVAVT